MVIKSKNELQAEIKQVAESWQENPEAIAEYLAFASKFYQYSRNNTIAIYLQNPHATFVGSFLFWKNKGYSVKQSETGLKILVPTPVTVFERDGELVQLRYANTKEKQRIKQGEIRTRQKMQFLIGTVFDIAQTTCPTEEYPNLYHMGYTDKDQAGIIDGLTYYSKEKLDCSVYFTDLPSISLRGRYLIEDNAIELNLRLKDSEKLSTLAHEIGHAVLHNEKNRQEGINITQIELEADMLAYMIQSKIGIELTAGRKRHLSSHYKEFIAEQQKKEESQRVHFSDVLTNVLKRFDTMWNDMEGYIEYGKDHVAFYRVEETEKYDEKTGTLLQENNRSDALTREQRRERQSEEWQEKIDRARSVSISDVVSDAGYQLSGIGKVLSTKEYYGIKVYPESNSYYNWGTKKGGTPIDFLINECGMEKKDAINRLAGEGGYYEPDTGQEERRSRRQQDKTPDKASFFMPDKAENNKRVYAYLSARGIKGEITHDFIHKGLLYESAGKHNCVFVGLDDAGLPKAGYMRGTNSYAATPFRGNVPGSNKEYGVFYEGAGDTDCLSCFEASIDMMSFMQLRDTPSHKLAMSGIDDTSMNRVLARYPEIKKICFCLDNDEHGREAAAELKEKYEKMGYEAHEVFPPEGKDWNEWLNIKQSMEIPKEAERQDTKDDMLP